MAHSLQLAGGICLWLYCTTTIAKMVGIITILAILVFHIFISLISMLDAFVNLMLADYHDLTYVT